MMHKLYSNVCINCIFQTLGISVSLFLFLFYLIALK